MQGPIGASNIVLIFVLLIIPVALTFLLKRTYPHRKWIGILLSLLSIFGHFYLEEGLLYFIALLLIFLIWTGYFGSNFAIVIIVNIISAGVMFYRFKKRENLPDIKA